MLPNPSSLCFLHNRPINLGKPAEWEDGRLMSQKDHLLGAWIPGSFMVQRWEEVRKQSKKTIYFLQMSPRMASLRQGAVLVSLPCSHFTGGMKWSISCHINKQICHSYLWFRPSTCEFLSQASKQETKGTISHTKNSRAGSGFLPMSQTKGP